MQIDSIELFHVALPRRKPLETIAGTWNTLQSVVVRMQSGDVSGWGEAAPGNAPLAGPDWAAGAFACLKDWLAPAVSGQMIDGAEALQTRLKPFRGTQFAKAALDAAWWDLEARRQGRPLHEVLGGTRSAISVGPTFDKMDSFDEFIAAIGRAFEAGFARVRLMLRPGWDVQMVDAVRREFPSQAIHVDVEGDLTLDQAEILQRLDDFCLEMVEQPLPAFDLVGHAMMQESISTAICLDESLTGVEQAEVALELKSCRYMNVQPGRAGGLTPAAAMHDLAAGDGVPCFVGAMPQSAIGMRTGLALAAKENFTYPSDFFPTEEIGEEILELDLADPLPTGRDEDGNLLVNLSSEPGIGIEPERTLLEKFAISRAKIV